MTDLTWRQQAEAAFRSALDSTARVTGSREAMTMTALHAALEVAERELRARFMDELGHDHYVIFTDDGWTTEHSVECRLSGRMFECAVHSSIGEWAEDEPRLSGRWRVIDASGPVPVLENADPRGDDNA